MSRHWNYRVIKHPKPTPDDDDYYSIHEVHYSDIDTIIAYSAEPCGFGSETLEGLADALKMVEEALSKPVLNVNDLPGHNK